MNNENNVILAVLKLSRAMRRCPPPPAEHPFPPAVGRLLACVAENPHVSSRDLCEFLDLRPSSLSEMLSRAESEGWITRVTDEEDRRIQRVDLSEKGKDFIGKMENARLEDLERKTSCLTEEEKVQFCALCGKLSAHLESLAVGLPPRMPRPPRGPRGPHGRGAFGRPGKPGFPEPPEAEDPESPEPPETSDSPEEPDNPFRPSDRFPKGRILC